MKYYKIINDTIFIGACSSSDFRKFQLKHKILLACDVDYAQYIQFKDKMYRDNWFCPVITDTVEYGNAKVIEIDEEEYNALIKAIEDNEEIIVQPDVPDVDENESDIDKDEEVTVDYVKEVKIREMSQQCNQIITNGVDVTLSDNKSHHFSLTIYDQIMISKLADKAKNGENALPWHEDNGECKFYSSEDILILSNNMELLITYQQTYFNSLKQYIKSLSDIKEIGRIKYGCEIPEDYRSDVLNALMKQGDDNV